MTLPHEYPRFLGGSNESLPGMLGRAEGGAAA
jgi:hypothetical protein